MAGGWLWSAAALKQAVGVWRRLVAREPPDDAGRPLPDHRTLAAGRAAAGGWRPAIGVRPSAASGSPGQLAAWAARSTTGLWGGCWQDKWGKCVVYAFDVLFQS